MTESIQKITDENKDQTARTGDQEPVLYTENVVKQFGNFTAVNNVSFAIAPNETRALIGPNGAGKTTFQNLITGKLPVTEGKIVFKGQDVTSDPPSKRASNGIIRKYQVTSIYENETVFENMCIALRGRTSTPFELAIKYDDSDIDDRIAELLEIADLDDSRDRVAGNLSHGEKQWLEIIMAVGAGPELLLLDEPTSGMSVSETNDTIDLMEDIRKTENIAILVIEHDMEFIRQVSNNITVLHHGEIIAEGSIDEIESNETVQEVYLGGTV